MTIARAVKSQIARYGRDWTLRRETVAAGANAWTKGSATVAYSNCKAKGRRYKPSEITGTILEHDELVTIDASSASTAPAQGDRIAPGVYTADAGAAWRQIVNVHATDVAGTVVSYRLQVRR